MNDVFPNAYEITRGRLLLKILVNRLDFKTSILSRLLILETKPKNCVTISAYQFTHPDTEFYIKKRQIYFLEDALNVPLTFFHINSDSDNRVSLDKPDSYNRASFDHNLLEKLILWNSSKVLNWMRLSPTFFDAPHIQISISRFPDLVAQYNSSERLPVVFHENSSKTLSERKDQQSLEPDILLNVEVWHQRFIVQDKRWIVTDITGSPYTEFVAGHWQFLEQSKNEGGDVFIKRPLPDSCLNLKSAIYLMGRADENWYHLLLDTLPRYLFLKEIDERVPVLVRSDLPKSSRKFLAKILDREIIFVKPEEFISAKKLFFIASRSTTFDSKPPNSFDQIKFPVEIYKDLQRFILGKLSKKRSVIYPKKIYLPRKSKYRNLLNESSVSELASQLGYSVVTTDIDFYQQQFHYFNQAENVLSPGGAVLANTIFMQPGSKVSLIRSWRGSDLLLWKKLADACDVHFNEVIGIPTYYGRNALSRQHSNFFLPLRRIRKLLKTEVS